MDVKYYLESGILEEYVLGMLNDEQSREVMTLCAQYPELCNEVAAIELVFEQLAFSQAVPPPISLQEKIWATLDNCNKEQAMDPEHLPLINEFTDTKRWLGLVKPFIPASIGDERTMHLLTGTATVLQMFVISKTDFEDETHDDLQESFIILEGECECTVGDEVFRVRAGGYASIPLHTPHTVRIISPYVMAIMQRVAV